MRQDELTELLRGRTASGQRGPACPDEHEVAAYVDGTLPPAGRRPLESHLADCDACLALVGDLSRHRPDDGRHRAPAWQRTAPAWAAAAMVVLAVAVVVEVVQQAGTPASLEATASQGDVRNAPPAAVAPKILSPRAFDTVDAAELVVRWTAVPGSQDYEVRIVSESGDLVAQGRVDDTQWLPGTDAGLEAGRHYFVQVDAFPTADRSLGSEHVPFSVAE